MAILCMNNYFKITLLLQLINLTTEKVKHSLSASTAVIVSKLMLQLIS